MSITRNRIASARSLLAPVEPSEFIERYLEREVLHLERQDPSLVEGVFDLDSIDHCLRYMQPQGRSALRVVAPDGGGERTAEFQARFAKTPDSGEHELRGLFADRHTLIFTGAEVYWPSIESIVMDLRTVLRADVRCNVYCTPPASQGFDTHADGHDVLVLQTSGSKTWRLHETLQELPMQKSRSSPELLPRLESFYGDFGAPSREIILQPGDLLYLPRGVPHSAASTDEHSIHLTIGLYPLRMHEYLSRIIDNIAIEQIELRRRTPVAWFEDDASRPSAAELLRRAAELADAAEPPVDVAGILQEFEQQCAPPGDPRGSTASVLASSNIDLDTVLERLEGARWRTHRSATEFRVSCGPTMALPLKLGPIMGFLERQKRFRVGDLPRILTDNAKRTLARNLVRHGLLRIANDAAPQTAAAPSSEGSSAPDISWLGHSMPNAVEGN